MNKITAIFKKQVKDTLKNKTILIQFVMFPLLTVIMENAVKPEGMPEHYFVTLFAAMYVGMAPLTSMAAVISEEKEKNTLRLLLMSNVKAWEYLAGVGSYIWLACIMGACIFGFAGGYRGIRFGMFLLIMCGGILVSLFLGAAIGVWCKSEMAATSLTVPVMLVFSFLPMLSMFNETIRKISRFTYSQQVSNLISQLGEGVVKWENILVIGGNMAAILAFFVWAYRKKGLT